MTWSGKRWVDSSLLSAGVVTVLALALMVNYLGWKHYKRFDWTHAEIYTLSEKSRNVMRSLDKRIEAIVFLSPSEPLFGPVQELLSRYAAASPQFSTTTIDPARNIIEAQRLVDKYDLSQANVVVFDRGDDRRVIETVDLAEYDYSGMQFGAAPELTAFKGEQAFTAAIVELVEDRKQKIVFTVGHGELALDELSARGLSELAALLRQDNFELEEWQSLADPAVPEDVDLVVIAGPTANFIAPEIEAFASHFDRGGRLLVLLDPVFGTGKALASSGLEDLLASYGADVGANIVVDPANPIPFYGAETIFVSSYGEHPITRSLSQAGVPVIVPLARSIGAAESRDDLEVEVLLRTSSEGWAEADLENLDRVAFGPEDSGGPVALAVAVSRAGSREGSETEPELQSGADAAVAESGEPQQRLVVVGDSDFIANGQLVNVGNAEFALNIVNWLTERDLMLGIPPKQTDRVRLSLSRAELRFISWLVFAILPGAAAVTGVVVFLRRRR